MHFFTSKLGLVFATFNHFALCYVQFNETCVNSSHCNESSGLICSGSQRCACKRHWIFFENSSNRCVAFAGGYCTPGHDIIGYCPSGTTCKIPNADLSEVKHLGNNFLPSSFQQRLESTGYVSHRGAKHCICDDETVPSHDKMSCIVTLKFNETCNGSGACDVSDGLYCNRQKVCACKAEKSYSDIWGRCYTNLGSICNSETQCGENALCSTVLNIVNGRQPYNFKSHKNGTCACVPGSKSNDVGQCVFKAQIQNYTRKVPKRQPNLCKNVVCDTPSGQACNMQTGQCDCQEPYIFYETETHMCVQHVGGYCNPDSKMIRFCPLLSSCKVPAQSDLPKMGRNFFPDSLIRDIEHVALVGSVKRKMCVCDNGYVADVHRKRCIRALKFDESCLDEGSNGDAVSCDVAAGLFCETYGACACAPGKMYSENWNKCYSPIATTCTYETQCGENAICSSLWDAVQKHKFLPISLQEKINGTCVCISGYSVNEHNGNCIRNAEVGNAKYNVTRFNNWIASFVVSKN